MKIKIGLLAGLFCVSLNANSGVYYYDSSNPIVVPNGYTSESQVGDTHIYQPGGSFTALAGSTNYASGTTITEGARQTFHAGSTTTARSSADITHGDQTIVENFGDFTLESGASIKYNSGSTYYSRSGSTVVNNTNVINSGDFIFDAGSVVTGTGSYTQQEGGSIVVNGDITQGSINILGSGYLGGSGTINGNVYAAGDDVIINSGNSPGQLTINGDLTVENGASIIMEIGASGHDTISVSGDFNISSGTNVIFEFLDDLDESILESFELGDFFEAIPETPASPEPALDQSIFEQMDFSFRGDSDTLVSLNVNTQGGLVQVSEPGTLALLLMGLAGLFSARRTSNS
jgi:hypothetical protein